MRRRMNVVVTGGAGFIGSNLVDQLRASKHRVTVIDNLSGGRREFIAHHVGTPGFVFVELDLRDHERLVAAIPRDTEVVFHLAANADIARGVHDPTLDFEQTTVATFSLLRAMQRHGIKQIVYTSGSGVYGDRGAAFSSETHGPLLPVSMYGATKASAEALISAFCHLYDMRAWIVRPANIIGPRATHGVVYDFVKRLRAEPTKLHILGDGKQSKAYLHVADVVDAIVRVRVRGPKRDRVGIYNLSSNSFVTVNQIAKLVLAEMKLRDVKITHGGGKIGWKGDVAVVRLRNTKLAKLGWRAKHDSASAVRATVRALLAESAP
jgi:UDP-glucose 4-epimerase